MHGKVPRMNIQIHRQWKWNLMLDIKICVEVQQKPFLCAPKAAIVAEILKNNFI